MSRRMLRLKRPGSEVMREAIAAYSSRRYSAAVYRSWPTSGWAGESAGAVTASVAAGEAGLISRSGEPASRIGAPVSVPYSVTEPWSPMIQSAAIRTLRQSASGGTRAAPGSAQRASQALTCQEPCPDHTLGWTRMTDRNRPAGSSAASRGSSASNRPKDERAPQVETTTTSFSPSARPRARR